MPTSKAFKSVRTDELYLPAGQVYVDAFGYVRVQPLWFPGAGPNGPALGTPGGRDPRRFVQASAPPAMPADDLTWDHLDLPDPTPVLPPTKE